MSKKVIYRPIGSSSKVLEVAKHHAKENTVDLRNEEGEVSVTSVPLVADAAAAAEATRACAWFVGDGDAAPVSKKGKGQVPDPEPSGDAAPEPGADEPVPGL